MFECAFTGQGMSWFKSFWKTRTTQPAQPAPECRELDKPLQNFTPRANQALKLAQQEAERLRHNFIGTEHVLLGLIRVGQGVTVNVLGKMGLDLETVRLDVEKQIGTGPDQTVSGSIPSTPRVKKVLTLADKERRALNHKYVGTEHLLLGLIREGDGVAARVLKQLGLDVNITRHYVLRELDPNYIWPPEEGTTPGSEQV